MEHKIREEMRVLPSIDPQFEIERRVALLSVSSLKRAANPRIGHQWWRRFHNLWSLGSTCG